MKHPDTPSNSQKLQRTSTKLITAKIIIILVITFLCSNAYAANIIISQFFDTPDPVPRGGEVTYSFTVENQSADTANNVVLTYNLPADTEFVSLNQTNPNPTNDGTCSHDGGTPGTVTCSYGNLNGTINDPDNIDLKRLLDVVIKVNTPLPNYDTSATVTADASPDYTENQNTTVLDAADLVISLTSTPPLGNPGDDVVAGGDIVYTANITNDGPTDIPGSTDIVVSFELSPNVTYLNSSGSGWTCPPPSGTPLILTCTRSAGLTSGTSTPITFTTRVSEVSGTITTSGTISPHSNDPNHNNNVATNNVAIIPGTDVGVTISASPSSVIESNTTTITLSPRNYGPTENAANAVVNYTIPQGFSLDLTSPPTHPNWTCDFDSLPDISCTRTSLPTTAVDNISFDLIAPAWADPKVLLHEVTITTSTAEADDKKDNNSDSITIILIQAGADLRLTKSKTSGPLLNGATVSSSLRVQNLGPLDAASGTIVVTDTLDMDNDTLTNTPGVDNELFVSATGTNWVCQDFSTTAPDVICTYNAPLPGNNNWSDILTIVTTATATVPAGGYYPLSNNAEVTYGGDPGDLNASNNTATATVRITERTADLAVKKYADPTSLPVDSDEDPITYTVRICNNGPDAATGITLTDEFNGYFNAPIVVTATPANYTCGAVSNNSSTGISRVTCSQQSGSLALTGADCIDNPNSLEGDVFTIEVKRPLRDGTRTNTASAYSSEVFDDDHSNNAASVDVNIDPVADIRLQSKTVTPNNGNSLEGFVQSGAEATYIINVRNYGPSTATNVEVKDTFTLDSGDTGFTFLSYVASGGGDCSIATYPTNMAPGTSYDHTSSPMTLTCKWTTLNLNQAETITMVIRPNYMNIAVPDPYDPLTDPYSRIFRNIAEIVSPTEVYDNDISDSSNKSAEVTLTILRDEIDLKIEDHDTPAPLIGPDPLGHNPLVGEETDNDIVYHVIPQHVGGASYATGVQFTFDMSPADGKEVEFRCDRPNPTEARSCAGPESNTCTTSSGTNPITGNTDGSSTLTLTCDYGALAVGETGHRYLTFRVITEPEPTGDTHSTNATISANEYEPIQGNNSEGELTNIRGKVDLVLTKEDIPGTVNLTEAFDWTLIVTNDGPSSSRETILTDNLAAYNMLPYDETVSCINESQAVDPAAKCECSISSGILTCDFGTININEKATVVVPVKVDNTSGTLENCATVVTADVDSSSSNNTDVCGEVVITNSNHPSDYGDAPDTDNLTGMGNYETLLNYGGARHYLDLSPDAETPFLGACVDADEAGNLQNVSATADDTSGPLNGVIGTCVANDDEDGIQIPVLVAGRDNMQLTVIIGGAPCNLSGWVDFNQDGDWTDAGEQVLADVYLTPGTHNDALVQIDIPPLGASYVVGNSYARFRCATETGLTSTDAQSDVSPELRTHPDYALDGEVEDYMVSLQPEYAVSFVDYGDAPDPNFPTTLLRDGASHILGVSDAPILGNCVDSDNGSLENEPANADDNDTSGTSFGTCSGNDEDGVSFPLLYADQDAELIVTVSGGTCLLNGWIDFNNDGVWSGSEQIFSNTTTSLPVGTHNLTVPIPVDVAIGSSYARFRCSSAVNDLGPIGAATDGEVEDYLIELLGFIRGQVRMDADDDGVLVETPPDSPIAGVTINLLDADNGNAVVTSTTTDVNGNYEFLGLSAGNYLVQEVDPADHASTNDVDNPDTPSETDNLIAVTLGNGGSSVGNDFIDTHLSSLGDVIWFDMNQNGIQDIGELGIAGITVNLYKLPNASTIAATTTTNGAGFYEFTDLRTGDFIVEFVQPADYTITLQNQGLNDALDSDGNTSTPSRTASISLPAGTRNDTLDAGMYLSNGNRPARLSNLVWYDSNNNGVQDTGEQGVAGVQVNLLNGAGTQLSTTTTNGTGIYEFTGLATGSYIIEFIRPAGYTFTPQSSGTDTTLDSDANTVTGRTAVIALQAGENNPDIDAGLFAPGQLPASLGDRVWYDANQDGIQDSTEIGLGGVTVSLFAAAAPESAISTSITDGNGAYGFSGLLPGNYIVHFALPTGYSYTLNFAGADTAIDSNADQITGRSGTITLAAGDDNPSIDAGLYLTTLTPVTIGDVVYLDANYDGDFDAGEGLSGVDLILYNLFSMEIGRTTTASNGGYLFSGLPPGSYYVEVDTDTLPTGVYQIEDPDAVYDSAHQALNVVTDRLTVDFGYSYNNIIGDYVWLDENQDGIQNPSENGVSGVNVTLLDSGGSPLATTATDGNGYYEFANLAAGDYRVEFTLPTGFLFTSQDLGSGTLQDSYDSDASTATGQTALFTLTDNEVNRTIDAGMYLIDNIEPASLGNYVWFDLDQDGIQEIGESGVSGVTVNLYDFTFSTILATVITDGAGFYSFTGLIAGDYGIEFSLPAGFSFSPADQGGDDTLDSDADATSGKTAVLSLNAGDQNTDQDAGIYLTSLGSPSSLGDRVWYDANVNGIQDSGEAGVGGVTVQLFQAIDLATPVSSIATDASGNYLFTGLTGGDYVIRFLPPAGYSLSPQGNGTPSTDSDADQLSGFSETIVLTTGENNSDIDAGISNLSSALYTIGDLVWLDRNHNGTFDSGEGLENIELVLYYNTGGEVQRTTTDANGIYSFNNVLAGDYRVSVNTASLPLDTTPDPDVELIQIADPDTTFDDSHQLISFNADTDIVDFGYRESEVDVELDKSFSHSIDTDGNSKINTGDVLTFTISVINNGPETATGVEVTDQLPVGYTLGAVTASQGVYTVPIWDIGTLPVGGTATLNIEATVTNLGTYRNSAEVTATNEYDIDSTPDNNVPSEDDQDDVTPYVQNFPWTALMAAIPPCPPTPEFCYVVSDQDSTQMDNSALFKYTFSNNQISFLGRLGVGDVESIALSLDGKTLYAVNNGVLGVIDTSVGTTEAFIPVTGIAMGSGNGASGTIKFQDIDGLAFDPITNELYGSVRRSEDLNGFDMLIKIDVSSGTILKNGFGPDNDYLIVDSSEFSFYHIDDIAINGQGVLYGVLGNSGVGGGELLVIIDKDNGSITPVNTLMGDSVQIQDMEGFTYYFRNTFFGTTGVEMPEDGNSNSLFKINSANGDSSKIIKLDGQINGFYPYDFEAISCPICK